MTNFLASNLHAKAKLTQLKNKWATEEERRNILLKELRLIQKLERSVRTQKDQQHIAEIKRHIASI